MSGPYALPSLAPAQPTLEGDERLLGVNLKLPRWQLPPGLVARSENKRYNRGIAEDRRGTRTPIFANTINSQNLLGSDVYSNPNGKEVALIATPERVFAIRSGTIAQEILTAQNPRGNITFSQQFDKVLMHSDDSTLPVMQWDGLSGAGFVLIAASKAPGNGITIIPNVPWSINYLGRAWFPIPSEPGWFGASDVNDYTVYDSILHKFRINAATADALVGLYPYPSSFGLIVGKQKSFDLLGPIPGDLGDNWINSINLANSLGVAFSPASAPPPRMSPITGPKGVGIRARRGALFVGNGEFHFLSDAGDGAIYRIVPTGSSLAIDPIPVSDPIEPLMRRINWAAAGGAVAELDGNFALWAVPLDGAIFNNAILVYNIVSQQWQGVDRWFARATTGRVGRTNPPQPNPMRMDNLLGFDFYGRRRVFAVSYNEGLTRLLYEGREDQLAPASTTGQERRTFPIVGLIETRGYATLGATGKMRRRMNALQMVLATYDANVTVTELCDGVNDAEVKATVLPNRTLYDLEARAATPYQVDNANDDFLDFKRQDYAIRAGDNFLPGTKPTPLEVEQEQPLNLSLSRETRYVSYRVESNGGTCAVLGTVVESAAADREGRSAT